MLAAVRELKAIAYLLCPVPVWRSQVFERHFSRIRGEQWSFMGSNGMVIFIFARTIGINGFLMVLGLLNHYLKLIFSPQTITFNDFSMVLGSFNHWFQWFSMVMDHWSNNAMVSMDRSPLLRANGNIFTKISNK